jgi:DNA repair protein RecO (recombination protein O)
VKTLLQTKAFVLKESDYGESDKILTLFSRDAGKLSCIAKGAKRSKKRFVNKLEQFTCLEVYYAPGGQRLNRLDHAEVLDHFGGLRKDYHRYVAAALAAEIVLPWIKENDADPASFSLLAWTLKQLDAAEDITSPLLYFLIRTLSLQGYKPIFDSCTVCGESLSAIRTYLFQPRRFGVICDRCQPSHLSYGASLSLRILKLLHHAQSIEAERVHRLHFTLPAKTEAFKIMRQYFSFLLHRDFPSWNILDKVFFSVDLGITEKRGRTNYDLAPY